VVPQPLALLPDPCLFILAQPDCVIEVLAAVPQVRFQLQERRVLVWRQSPRFKFGLLPGRLWIALDFGDGGYGNTITPVHRVLYFLHPVSFL
jgi:hypothetical protein